MDIEEKIGKLGLELPSPAPPVATYIGAKQTGNLVFTAGQAPFRTTKRGMVGEDLTVEEGYQAARETCLNCLSRLKAVIGDLNKIRQVMQVIGFINSAEGFMNQPAVLNGFTDLLVELFGKEKGTPTRAALPVHHPGWISIEAWMIVEIKQ